MLNPSPEDNWISKKELTVATRTHTESYAEWFFSNWKVEWNLCARKFEKLISRAGAVSALSKYPFLPFSPFFRSVFVKDKSRLFGEILEFGGPISREQVAARDSFRRDRWDFWAGGRSIKRDTTWNCKSYRVNCRAALISRRF